MKNIALPINFQNILVKIKTNKILFLVLIWFLIFIFGNLIIVSNIKVALKSRKDLDIILPSKGVRFQNTDFQEVVKRIEKGKVFLPKEPLFTNPF